MEFSVKTSSERIWWGIYGLVDHNGWEDVDIYDQKGIWIDRIHLYAKSYLRAGLKFTKNDAEQLDYVMATENHLKNNDYSFWFYYDQLGDPERYEVEYDAPRNRAGIKPKAIEIWLPEERIGIKALKASIKKFATFFLKIENCTIKIDPIKTVEESIKTFQMSEEFQSIKVNLSPQQIYELSKLWNNTGSDIYNQLCKFNRKK